MNIDSLTQSLRQAPNLTTITAILETALREIRGRTHQTTRLRRPDAARYLKISLSSLEKFATEGGGPRYSKLGKSVVYEIADLDFWLDERKVNSSSEADALQARLAGTTPTQPKNGTTLSGKRRGRPPKAASVLR